MLLAQVSQCQLECVCFCLASSAYHGVDMGVIRLNIKDRLIDVAIHGLAIFRRHEADCCTFQRGLFFLRHFADIRISIGRVIVVSRGCRYHFGTFRLHLSFILFTIELL